MSEQWLADLEAATLEFAREAAPILRDSPGMWLKAADEYARFHGAEGIEKP